jgi:hypothetical protein
MELLSVLKHCGPLILVTVFLLWHGWARETRVSKHIAKLEDEYHRRRLRGWPLSLLSRPRRGDDS